MTPPTPPGGKCTRRVGFLFPHPCLRTTTEGCPDCRNGQIDDPYGMRDRYDYSSYDDYGDDLMDFTEADGADLVKPDDEFETDPTES